MNRRKRKFETPKVGDKFTDWLVIDDNIIELGKSQFAVTCQCVCGVEKPVRITALQKGLSKGCECRGLRINLKKGTCVGDLSRTLYGRFEKSARVRKIEWGVDMEYLWGLYLKQNKKCALSDVDLHMQKQVLRGKGESNITASLDRIDSSKGYIKGNVQWVHKDVNKMKQDLNESYFVELCKLISNKNYD